MARAVGVQFAEAQVAEKAHAAGVFRVHVPVDAGGASFPQRGQLRGHEPAAVPAALDPREQVNVQMRWVGGEPVIVGQPGVVNLVGGLLVRSPAVAVGGVGVGQGLDPLGRLRAFWPALGLAKARHGTAPYAVADVGRDPPRTTSGVRLPGVWQARCPGCPV